MKSWIFLLLSTAILVGCGTKPAEPVGSSTVGQASSQSPASIDATLTSNQGIDAEQLSGSGDELTDEEDAEFNKEEAKSPGPLKVDYSHWTNADMVGEWGRLYNGLISHPESKGAKEFGSQTLTFYPDGTFICEGWQVFYQFKKSGTYSVENGELIMRDLKKISASNPNVWEYNWMDITSSKFDTYYGCRIAPLPMINLSATGNLAFVKYLTFDEKSMCYRYVSGVEVDLK